MPINTDRNSAIDSKCADKIFSILLREENIGSVFVSIIGKFDFFFWYALIGIGHWQGDSWYMCYENCRHMHVGIFTVPSCKKKNNKMVCMKMNKKEKNEIKKGNEKKRKKHF